MYDYPLEMSFKIVTLGTRVRVVDAAGRQVAYVRKKKFRLKEDIGVYRDESQKDLLFRLKADRMMDFGASYAVSGADGRSLGAVRRHGMRSMWKSHYGISDTNGTEVGYVHEENPWVKVLDGFMESLPFGDALGGLFFNPAYLVELRGGPVLRMKKERAVLESRFTIEKLKGFSEEDEERLLAGLIMTVLLERDRG